MGRLTRFSLLPGLLTACCLLIYAAGLIGRAIPAMIVAGRERDSTLDPMHVLLIDLSRGLSIERRIAVPDAIRADWDMRPPQVLMRRTGPNEVIFTLNRLDFSHMRLESLVTHRVPADPRPRDLIVAFSGQRAAVYSPATGEVTLIDRALPVNPRVSVTENSTEMVMAWSPDGRILAVKDYRSGQLALLDGASIRLVGTFRNAAPVWLPDGRSILLAQDSFVGRNGRILILDAITGKANPHTESLVGRSAAICGTRLLGYVYVTPDGGHTVQTRDLDTGETMTILETGRAGDQEVTALTFAPRAACDWLLLEMRRPNERESKLYRLHLPTSDLGFLGDNARVLELTAEAAIYASTTAGVAFTVQRAAFAVDTEPEIFGRIPAQNEAILWMEGYRRGLFLRSGQLWTLDLSTGTTPLLTVPARLQDLQLVPED